MINCPVCKHPHEDELSDRLPALATDLCWECQEDISSLVADYEMMGEALFVTDPDDPDEEFPMYDFKFITEEQVIRWFINTFHKYARRPTIRRCEVATFNGTRRCRRIGILLDRKGLKVCGSHNGIQHVTKAYWHYPENHIPDEKKITCMADIEDIKTPADMILALKFLLSENTRLKTDRNANRE